MSLLPKQYHFLINPLNNQKIQFTSTAAASLTAVFHMMQNLLQHMDSDPELILVHLNSLLTEINATYFATGKKPADDRLSTYICLKLMIENNLIDHTTVNKLAKKLAVNTNSLYSIVKYYSGLSPKAFITNQLILEAKRRLYNAGSASGKVFACCCERKKKLYLIAGDL